MSPYRYRSFSMSDCAAGEVDSMDHGPTVHLKSVFKRLWRGKAYISARQTVDRKLLVACRDIYTRPRQTSRLVNLDSYAELMLTTTALESWN
ncbi:hypothetical protein TNCV_4908541 [Trichonephila clavipes]|uniref:Uncharacterized protein n=1 Tax=Trichonephila clavipes TaxID=2585209 RepID=A0A8X6RVE6_TRICX|nr:hypothetical protein TNCV_4908541 [Trichonephila clavipes]